MGSGHLYLKLLYVKELDDDNDSCLKVYPLPTKDVINIDDVDIKLINIYDIYGKLIMSLENDNDNITINVTDFTDGVYIVETFDNNSNRKNAKFIVKK